MPLTYAGIGESRRIIKITGKSESQRHLEELGFTPGSEVELVGSLMGNVIAKVRDTRVAISKELANRIIV
ncbi:hypothetical protein FACS1894105_00340 [Clostridia bacterium]|nr:hypothetical protein FACS1894105_00340 [Clostridia bacterium]